MKFGSGKKTQREDHPGTVEEASSGSSGYPESIRVSALRERRLLISLRGVSFALILAIILNAVQAFTIVGLMPLKEVRPFLVQIAEEGTLVAAIQPIQDTFEAKDVLTEKLVREYVVNRHEILRSSEVMRRRWSPSGYVGTTTGRDEYDQFRQSVAPTMNDIMSAGAARRAQIKSVSAVSAGELYIVDFESISYDRSDNVIGRENYTATIEIAFRPLANLTREQMLINPTGFTVVNYSLAQKDL